MASKHLLYTIIRPISANYFPCPLRKPQANSLSFIKQSKNKTRISLSSQEQIFPPSVPKVNVERLVEYLSDHLPRVFDDQGVDWTAYDDQIKFRDPITKYDDLRGYLFNVAMLKMLFSPAFQLHWIRQTGTYEISSRWTTEMTFLLLPWKPFFVITGTSVMGINPKNGKICSHVDYWDSINNNDYFSLEGLVDFIKQLQIYQTPDLETPKYQILKRTSTYEVRKYNPFIIVEAQTEKLTGLMGFNDVVGYILGKNSRKEKIRMTTPVFTQAFDPEMSKTFIQIVLPSKDMTSLPDPNKEAVSLRSVQGGFAAVLKFSDQPTEDIVREKEKLLRSTLLSDCLKPKDGCSLARYDDFGQTKSCIVMKRNEVLIWLKEFALD